MGSQVGSSRYWVRNTLSPNVSFQKVSLFSWIWCLHSWPLPEIRSASPLKTTLTLETARENRTLWRMADLERKQGTRYSRFNITAEQPGHFSVDPILKIAAIKANQPQQILEPACRLSFYRSLNYVSFRYHAFLKLIQNSITSTETAEHFSYTFRRYLQVCWQIMEPGST